MTCRRLLQLKRDIIITAVFLKILCHLYPLESEVVLNGRSNRVNKGNIDVGISQCGRRLHYGVAALKGFSYKKMHGLFTGTNLNWP